MSERSLSVPPEQLNMDEAVLLAWAQARDIQYTDHEGMRGDIPITWNGQLAVVGWMARQPGKAGLATVSPYEVTEPERMTILEGQVKVKIQRGGEAIVPAEPPYVFEVGDRVIFSKPTNTAQPGTDEEPGRCWYVTTYPEQETDAVPQEP